MFWLVQGPRLAGDPLLGVAVGVISTGAVFEVALCIPSTGVGMGFNGKATAALGRTTRGFGLMGIRSAILGTPSAVAVVEVEGTLDGAGIVTLAATSLGFGSSLVVCTAGAGVVASPGLSACFSAGLGGGGIAAFFAAIFAAWAAFAAAAFVGAVVTGVTVTGRISVLSSRFFLGFGSGAADHISTLSPSICQLN